MTFVLKRRRFIAFLGFGALSACAGPFRAVRQGPALWLARKSTALVYLFGQMPVRTGTDWLTPAIESAFDNSDLVWLENPDYSQQSPETLEAVQALDKRQAPPADFSVLTVLDTARRQRLLEILEREGLGPDSLNGRRLAYTRQLLSFIQDRDSGADFQGIPEAIFRRRAKAAGKPIFTEWRDLLEVSQWATDMPEVQKELVLMTLDEIDNDYQAELDSWLNGTLDVQTGKAESRARLYPELYRHINTLRNAAMAGRIQKAMEEYEQLFVCLGISHLVGPESVPDFLRRAGLEVDRV